MANARNKTIDKTYLSVDNAEERGFIHRDYIAHCLRWSHVCKRLYERNSYRSARILDVGCGRELPLAKLLYSSKLIPEMYFGVDAGPIEDAAVAIVNKTGKFPLQLWDNHNFLEMTNGDFDVKGFDKEVTPNIVTCFEVLEHVEPIMMMEMLEHMHSLTTDDCRYFISTPNWNRVDCAANHVNEMLYEALGAAFERHGFHIEHVYGTFASIRDYEHLLLTHRAPQPSLVTQEVFTALREYYDTNFLSCVFAPLFPAQSRNCLWELRKQKPNDRNVYDDIKNIKTPWSSSALWEDMKL